MRGWPAGTAAAVVVNDYRGNDGNLSQMTRRWLSHPPAPAQPVPWYGEQCPYQGCFKILCGTSEQQVADRLADHKQRCHA